MKSITLEDLATIANLYNFSRVSEDVYFFNIKTSKYDIANTQKIFLVHEEFDEISCVSVYEDRRDMPDNEVFYISSDNEGCYISDGEIKRYCVDNALASVIQAVEHFFSKYSLNLFRQ